jgi:hypothetical protein
VRACEPEQKTECHNAGPVLAVCINFIHEIASMAIKQTYHAVQEATSYTYILHDLQKHGITNGWMCLHS